jgi:Fic family protein
MYEPNVRATDKLGNSLQEIEDTRELLSTIPFLPIVEEPIKKRALAQTVHYTTLLEGNRLDIQAVERLGVGQLSRHPINRDEREVVNLYKAMDFIRDIAPKKDIAINEDIIRQIHAYVVRDIPEQGGPGTYRLGQNAVADEATRQPVFMPPKPSDVAPLMHDLSTWLCQRPLAFHPVIVAGMAHLELVAIHPFDDGNGRTARALADLILDRHEYSLRYLYSWVAQPGMDMAAYHRALRLVLGTEYGAAVDPSIWLEYFAESVAKSLAEKRPELLRIRKSFIDAYNLATDMGLSKNEVEAIIFATTHESVTTGVFLKATWVSRSTAVKRLSELVEAGILKVEGKGRNVRYIRAQPEELTSKARR